MTLTAGAFENVPLEGLVTQVSDVPIDRQQRWAYADAGSTLLPGQKTAVVGQTS